MPLLAAGNFPEVRASLARADTLRDEFNQKVEDIRTDMLAQVRVDAVVTMRDQQKAIVISMILTVLAAILAWRQDLDKILASQAERLAAAAHSQAEASVREELRTLRFEKEAAESAAEARLRGCR